MPHDQLQVSSPPFEYVENEESEPEQVFEIIDPEPESPVFEQPNALSWWAEGPEGPLSFLVLLDDHFTLQLNHWGLSFTGASIQ